MLNPVIAEELRLRGHDVVTVRDIGLLGAPDEAVMDAAVASDRVVVTRNIKDFAVLVEQRRRTGVGPGAVLLVSTSAFADDDSAIGPLLEALDARLCKPGSPYPEFLRRVD